MTIMDGTWDSITGNTILCIALNDGWDVEYDNGKHGSLHFAKRRAICPFCEDYRSDVLFERAKHTA